jgi:peptidoglycan/xylan/chitin deacetylase (PgdA/CDA1 family)
LNAAKIAGHVLRDARPGSIILLHDGDSTGMTGRGRTVAALSIIINGLDDRGLRVAPLSKLLPSVLDKTERKQRN